MHCLKRLLKNLELPFDKELVRKLLNASVTRGKGVIDLKRLRNKVLAVLMVVNPGCKKI